MIVILTDRDLSSTGRQLGNEHLKLDHLKVSQRVIAQAQAVVVVRGGQAMVIKNRVGSNNMPLTLENPSEFIQIVDYLEGQADV